MKVLISASNSSSCVLWDSLISRLGQSNLYVCSDAPGTFRVLKDRGVRSHQILSTERPFYNLAANYLGHGQQPHAEVINQGLSVDEYARCHELFGIFAHQCSRLLIGGSPVYDLMDLYFLCVKYWLSILDKEEINLIYFSQVPHTGGDFCLYVASCIRKNIRVVNGHPICRSVLFVRTALPLRTCNYIGDYNSSEEKFNCHKQDLLISLVDHVSTKKKSKPLVIEDTVMKVLDQLPVHKCLLDGSRPENYFVFFLGSEPEAACNPNGYPFLTSKQAIEYLLDQLPPDAVLVLREHPVMLSGEKSFAWRDESSFKRVRGDSLQHSKS